MAYYKQMENGKWKMTVDLGRDPITNKRKQATRIFDRKKDAIDAAEQLRREFKKKNPTSLTFERLYKLWDESADIKESSRTNRYYIFKAHILPYFSRKKVDKVKPLDIENFVKWLRQKGLKSNYISLILKNLNVLFNKAVSLEMIDRNPMNHIKVKKDKVKKTAWTVEEAQTFLAYCKDNSLYWMAYYLALHCGLRIGEICTLKWEDISEDSISIVRTAARVGTISTGVQKTKSDASEREIPLNNSLRELLKEWENENEWLFPGTNNFISPDTIRGDFKRLINETGLPHIKFHDLRATHITMLLDAGVPVHIVSKRVGHTNIAMTLNVYSRVHDEKLKESSDTIDTLLNVVKPSGKDL